MKFIIVLTISLLGNHNQFNIHLKAKCTIFKINFIIVLKALYQAGITKAGAISEQLEERGWKARRVCVDCVNIERLKGKNQVDAQKNCKMFCSKREADDDEDSESNEYIQTEERRFGHRWRPTCNECINSKKSREICKNLNLCNKREILELDDENEPEERGIGRYRTCVLCTNKMVRYGFTISAAKDACNCNKV